ncbi:unnamed protein product [Owenia fusiformis]|uniref:Uncharacterized protein n=1 Tax=Owenia fusiformis TaxID=6347 RepID=A0A8J1YCM2_OWEFU|nr:unnamed protein product [Owenia fusiformis]
MARLTPIRIFLLLSATFLFIQVYLVGSIFDADVNIVRSIHSAYGYFGSTCTPARNIVFIKVPKCGGSTITNIFQRYGEKHNLRFLFPKAGNSTIHSTEIRDHIGDDVNLIVNHVRFNEKFMKHLMPRDTLYIGVLRNPIGFLKSYYNYAEKGIITKGNNVSLADFEENPWKYPDLKVQRNRQSLYYGQLDKDTTSKGIDEFILHVDSMFDLILITDHMKESIVLLGELLCWSMEDMLYVSHKVSTDGQLGGKSTTSFEHSSNMTLAEKNYQMHSPSDYAMFEFFNKTLWRKISAMGKSFDDKLSEFEAMLNNLQNRCRYTSEGLGLSDEYIQSVIKEDSDSEDYLCHRMLLPSPQYIEYILRPKQKILCRSFKECRILTDKRQLPIYSK